MNRINLFLLVFSLILISISIPSLAQDWTDIPQLQFDYRGNWSSTASYNSNDAVRGSNGKLYVGVEDNIPVNTNPVSSSRYWAEAVANRGAQGARGPQGNSIDTIFTLSVASPALPTSPTYTSGTFNNIGSWSNTIPIGGDPVWIALYSIDDTNVVTYIAHTQISGPRGPPGTTGIQGPGGNSIAFVYQTKSWKSTNLTNG